MDANTVLATHESAFLLLAAQHTLDAIVVTNRYGHITWANEGFHQLCGYDLSEVLGRKPGTLLQGPLSDPATVQRIRSALDGRQQCTEEIVNYHKDGHPYWVWLYITPIIDQDGELLRFIAIERDVTHYKEAERALQEIITDQRAVIEQWQQHVLLPICASCKRIRIDGGEWQQIELYFKSRTPFDFTHTLCPECIVKLYPEES